MSVRTVVGFDIIDIRRYFGIAERSFGKLFDIGIHTDPMAVDVNPKNIFLRSDPDVADWPIKNCTKKDPAEFFSIFFIRHYLLKKKSSIRFRSSTVQYAQFLSTVISYKFLNNIYFLCKKK